MDRIVRPNVHFAATQASGENHGSIRVSRGSSRIVTRLGIDDGFTATKLVYMLP